MNVRTVESFLFVGANYGGLSTFCWFVGSYISGVTGLLQYNLRQLVTLLYLRGDV